MQRDSIGNTFLVAGGVCLVCSLAVSAAAVYLKPLQKANMANDRMMNILLATGDISADQLDSPQTISQLFSERVQDRIIDLESGEDVTDSYTDGITDNDARRKAIADFDAFKQARSKDPEVAVRLDKKQDIARIKWKEKRAHVYLYQSTDGVQTYIFPIRGYGLWSTLQGFMALKSDLNTIAGLTYYEHKETPGLGGEVDNPSWKAQWRQEKYLSGDDGKVRISVVSPEPDEHFKVDSLSGATITSRGVENMIHFWMGEQGFGKFIQRTRDSQPTALDNGVASGGLVPNRSSADRSVPSNKNGQNAEPVDAISGNTGKQSGENRNG